MDALDLLEQQHLEVSALMARIAAEPSPARLRTAMVAMRLSRMIDAHARIEETYLYPRCVPSGWPATGSRSTTRTRSTACALRGGQPAAHARDRCALRGAPPAPAGHFRPPRRRGGDILFPKAKRGLTDEQLDVIGSDLERAYEVLLRVGVPEGAPLARCSAVGPGAAPARAPCAPSHGAGAKPSASAAADRRACRRWIGPTPRRCGAQRTGERFRAENADRARLRRVTAARAAVGRRSTGTGRRCARKARSDREHQDGPARCRAA